MKYLMLVVVFMFCLGFAFGDKESTTTTAPPLCIVEGAEICNQSIINNGPFACSNVCSTKYNLMGNCVSNVTKNDNIPICYCTETNDNVAQQCSLNTTKRKSLIRICPAYNKGVCGNGTNSTACNNACQEAKNLSGSCVIHDKVIATCYCSTNTANLKHCTGNDNSESWEDENPDDNCSKEKNHKTKPGGHRYERGAEMKPDNHRFESQNKKNTNRECHQQKKDCQKICPGFGEEICNTSDGDVKCNYACQFKYSKGICIPKNKNGKKTCFCQK